MAKHHVNLNKLVDIYITEKSSISSDSSIQC